MFKNIGYDELYLIVFGDDKVVLDIFKESKSPEICNHGCEASKNTFRPLGGHALLVPKILHAKSHVPLFWRERWMGLVILL